MKLNSLLFVLLLSTQISAQWSEPSKFPNTFDRLDYKHSVLLNTEDGKLFFFWIEIEKFEYAENELLYYSVSNDSGATWNEKKILDEQLNPWDSELDLSGIVTNSGRIIIAYKSWNRIVIKYSSSNGMYWSDIAPDIMLSSGTSFTQIDSNLFLASSNSNSISIHTSKDNGLSWNLFSYIRELGISKTNPHLFNIDNELMLIYMTSSGVSSQINKILSTNDGIDWSEPQVIFQTGRRIENLSGAKKNNGNILLYYDRETQTPFDSIFQSDIYIIKSSDSGISWSNERKLTNYVGNDNSPWIYGGGNDTYLCFSSDRFNAKEKNQFWLSKVEAISDNNSPPYIYETSYTKRDDSLSVSFKAYVDDDINIDLVQAIYRINSVPHLSVKMYDDGEHEDELPNDNIYGVTISNFEHLYQADYSIRAIDNQSNEFLLEGDTIQFSIIPISLAYTFDINNIKLPIDHSGRLADTQPYFQPDHGAKYDDIVFLFSSGFYLSGINNNEVWTNGMLTASRIEDYLPGPVNSNPNDIKNKLYLVRKEDAPFGITWTDWEYAVSLGAKFYDGNNDGIYNPIDFNNNGLWDSFEDRPDIQGDLTAWCVYSDAMPRTLRRLWVDPKGIEVRQSIFASEGKNTYLEDIIFLRYEITNTGTVAEVFDSVYFAAAIDPDLGDFNDDLVGCDTLHSSCYVYNDGYDLSHPNYGGYGINAPSFFIKQLQGPPVYIPDETYIDNNSNGKFDSETDTPLDSAEVKRGKYLGIEYISGAKNLSPSSFTQYMSSHPTHGDPDTHLELRNYLIGGMGKNGYPMDPCAWTFGNGSSLLNCNEINPKFMYSGDPVTSEGWLNDTPNDQRFLFSTGPFTIKAGEPIELIYAYIVGRGTDHLNSITVAREISQFAQTVYDNNFKDLDSLIINNDHLLLKNFELFQNFPNPFNQTTKLKYTIPFSLTQNGIQEYQVQIKVFDILGREIRTLVNEQKPAGTYEIQFDASSLSSGVYFYQLSAGNFIQTKKLMLLK